MNSSALYRVILSLAVLVAATTARADAGAVKIAYVDLQKALQSVDAGKKAKAQLEKDVQAKRSELEKTQAQLQQEAEQFEKKAAILNDQAKAAKQAELQKRFMEFQKTAADSQMELQKRERELTGPLIQELRAIIEGVGKERGLTLVLEKNEGAVLYAESGSDLTDEVVGRFNKTHKDKGSTKKRG